MYKKFAYIDYVKSNDEIPIRLSNYNRSMDLYVKTYNPFTASSVVVANESGYYVKLPITAAEAGGNKEKAGFIIENAISALKDFDVEIVLPPKNLPLSAGIKMNIADGIRIYPFFLTSAIKRVIKRLGLSASKCEILVLAGRKTITDCILYNIYDNTNFLSLMDNQNELSIYDDITADIFDDNGLNVVVTEYSKALAGAADIIINAADPKSASLLEYTFKKNAVYFDLTEKSERPRRRGDIALVDSIQISAFGEQMSLPMFELAFYTKSREYRLLCEQGGNAELIRLIKNQITDMKAYVSSVKFAVY